MHYTIKLCKGKTAFECRPKGKTELNLIDAEIMLKKLGYETLSQTPITLVMQKQKAGSSQLAVKIHIYPGGRLLIDNIENEEEADRTARRIYEKLMLKTND